MQYTYVYNLSVCLWVRPPRSPSLFIIGWCCSIPQTAAWLISRLCPLNLVCYFSRPMMFLVPSLPFPFPSNIHPGSFPPAVCPFPLSFYFSLFLVSVRVSHLAFPSSSVWSPVVRPADSSGGILRWTVDQCPLLDSSAPYVGLFPTCTADVTWLGCGLRGVGDGAPRNSPWVPRRVDRRRLANVFFLVSRFLTDY